MFKIMPWRKIKGWQSWRAGIECSFASPGAGCCSPSEDVYYGNLQSSKGNVFISVGCFLIIDKRVILMFNLRLLLLKIVLERTCFGRGLLHGVLYMLHDICNRVHTLANQLESVVLLDLQKPSVHPKPRHRRSSLDRLPKFYQAQPAQGVRLTLFAHPDGEKQAFGWIRQACIPLQVLQSIETIFLSSVGLSIWLDSVL